MSETRKREENNHKGRAGLVLGVLALILLVALLAVLIIAVIRLKDAPAGTGLFPAAQETPGETGAAAPAPGETAGRSIRFRLLRQIAPVRGADRNKVSGLNRLYTGILRRIIRLFL